MKKIIVSLLVLAAFGLAYGQSVTVDTTVGSYITASGTLMWYRDTGVAYTKLPMNAGIRISHKVYDGFGLTGTGDNYRITGQVFVPFTNLVPGLNVDPFVGAALNNSTAVTSSISVNAGLNSSLNLLSIAGLVPVLGGEILIFTDSSQIEYYGGFEAGILPGLKAAALYSAVYVSQQHKIGFGAKVSYSF